jgi:hypothetical protein
MENNSVELSLLGPFLRKRTIKAEAQRETEDAKK